MPRPHLKISVPEPCSESWAEMTPEGRGRFCTSCAKTVVDFSQFTDKELLAYFTGATGKVCGRFSPAQLNRPVYLETAPPPKFFSRAFAAAALFFGLASQTQAQKFQDHPTPSSVIQTTPNASSEKTVGKTPEKVEAGKLVISGRVIDSVTHEPIGFCPVILKESKSFKHAGVLYTQTDASGNFHLAVPVAYLPEKFTLLMMYVGYRNGEFVINGKELPLQRDFALAGISYNKLANEPQINPSAGERVVSIQPPAMFTGEVTVRSNTPKLPLVKTVLVQEPEPRLSFRDKLGLFWWKFSNLFRKKE